MSATVEATYEDGVLRLAQPLALPNHARVTVTVDMPGESADKERAEWLEISGVALHKTWDNEADDVFNELLTR